MVKFPEADVRKFKNIFVCKRCKTKIRAPNAKVKDGHVNCRQCKTNAFRAVRKK